MWFHRLVSFQMAVFTIGFSNNYLFDRAVQISVQFYSSFSCGGKKKKDFKTWVNSWTRWYLWTVFKRVLNFNFDRSPQENSGGLNQNVFDLRGWSTWEWIEVKCRYQATFVLVHLKLKKWNFGWNHRSLLMHSST